MKFILKPWDIRKSRLAAMDMHAAELGASVQGRKDFTGIEQAFRVERAFEALLLLLQRERKCAHAAVLEPDCKNTKHVNICLSMRSGTTYPSLRHAHRCAGPGLAVPCFHG